MDKSGRLGFPNPVPGISCPDLYAFFMPDFHAKGPPPLWPTPGSPGRPLQAIFPAQPDALAPKAKGGISVPAPWPGTAGRPPRQKFLPPGATRPNGGGVSIPARGASPESNPARQGGRPGKNYGKILILRLNFIKLRTAAAPQSHPASWSSIADRPRRPPSGTGPGRGEAWLPAPGPFSVLLARKNATLAKIFYPS
jgi:hypothetical protein